MPRRPATITQADIARLIRAAKQEGAREVAVQMPGGPLIIIRLKDGENKHFDEEEIVL